MSIHIKAEEKHFVNKLYDLQSLAEKNNTPAFSRFLNEREQSIAEFLLPSFLCKGTFYGGFKEAERKMVAVFPRWYEFSLSEFPLVSLAITNFEHTVLSHRDVLGSLIGLGLSRESIGDIMPAQAKCDVCLLGTVASVVLDELKKIGRIPVEVTVGQLDALSSTLAFVPKKGTVSSLRLDSLVSMLTSQSREKSAFMIKSELVKKNYATENRINIAFNKDDVITIRGYGKYIVDSIGTPTKKHRLPIECRQYK